MGSREHQLLAAPGHPRIHGVGPRGCRPWSRASAQTQNSLRILEADYQRYAILHTCRAPGTGRPSQVLAPHGTVARGVPGRGAGLARPPPKQPVASWGGGPSSRCLHTVSSFPASLLPHTAPNFCPQDLLPELKSSSDRSDKVCNHVTWPRKDLSASVTRVGVRASNHQQPGPARRSRAWGMGAQGLGWGRDLRQSLSEL